MNRKVCGLSWVTRLWHLVVSESWISLYMKAMVWKMSTKAKSVSYQSLQFDLGKENSGWVRSDAFSTGQSHIVRYIWSWGLARGAEACTYLYFTPLQSFWNRKGPSRHPASWWKKTSVYMLHTAPLPPNKAYPFRQKTVSLQSPSNQIRSSKGLFPPHFLVV